VKRADGTMGGLSDDEVPTGKENDKRKEKTTKREFGITNG